LWAPAALVLLVLGAACDDDSPSPAATASPDSGATQTAVLATPDPFASDEFDLFGFSFRKGAGVRVTDIALSTGTPSSATAGYVVWDSTELFFTGLAWNQTNEFNPEAAFDVSVRRAEGAGATVGDRGPTETLDVDELKVFFQAVSVDAVGQTYRGLFAAWFCDVSKTEFFYSAYDLTAFDNAAHVRQFAEGFDC
jgi:hypothetical protein